MTSWKNASIITLLFSAVVLLCVFRTGPFLWARYRAVDDSIIRSVDKAARELSGKNAHGLKRTTPLQIFSTSSKQGLVNCAEVSATSPYRVGQMEGPPSYSISYTWWFDKAVVKSLYKGEISIQEVRRLLRSTPDGEMLIDIGAHVGFAAMYGAVLGRPVIAVEPISYHVAKLCEGWRLNNRMGSEFSIYHAAAGTNHNISVQITRPADSIGYFDQSSLSKGAVFQPQTTTETIPMVRLDKIVPPEVKVGVVKIDVQGHEMMVLQGMTGLLSRREGAPRHILYEVHRPSEKASGVKPNEHQHLLESFGYRCKHCCELDMLCSKE